MVTSVRSAIPDNEGGGETSLTASYGININHIKVYEVTVAGFLQIFSIPRPNKKTNAKTNVDRKSQRRDSPCCLQPPF